MADPRPRKNWSREETLLAFRLYCYTPFGKLHQHNPDIIQLAQQIGRSPAAVAMKGCNFASLDPQHQQRGVTGLPNRSQLEDQIWQAFTHDSEAIAAEAEALHDSFATQTAKDIGADAAPAPPLQLPAGPTEVERTVRTRRVQRFFRQAVLAGYGHRCALTGLAIPQLLNASHIIPWSTPGSEQHRADPANGLCLNALHDRAFDRGLITFDENHRLLVSPLLADDTTPGGAGGPGGLGRFADAFTPQTQLSLPERFAPSPEALAYHREAVFQAA